MARKYDVEGTNKFLVWSIILALFAIWFIKDGWFPTEAILEKHPDPSDSYYLFNKSSGIISVIGAVICGYIHMVVR